LYDVQEKGLHFSSEMEIWRW